MNFDFICSVIMWSLNANTFSNYLHIWKDMNQFLNKSDSHVSVCHGDLMFFVRYHLYEIKMNDNLSTIIFKFFLIYLTKQSFSFLIVWMNAPLRHSLFTEAHTLSLHWNCWLKNIDTINITSQRSWFYQ